MTKPKRIFIVGYTGARKTLLSEALAKKLGWQVIDANPGLERDSLFEEVATLTIEPISVEEGVNKIINALEE